MATKPTKTEEKAAPAATKPTQSDAQVPATQQGGAVVAAEDSFHAFAGQGLQGLGKDDLAIPFLTILQSNSPQVKRSDGEYIEGAAEGMIFNTVTKEVLDPIKTPVVVIPCAYERHFVEWRTREKGGGFVKQHDVAAGLAMIPNCIRDEKGRDILPSGTQLNDTRTFYIMVLDADGNPSPALLTMTSTQIKKSKQWLMQQNLLKLRGPNGSYTPPSFATRWRLTTVPEQNDKGSWMGWAFTHDGYLKGPSDPVFIAAQEFHKSVTSGAVKVDLSKTATDPETGEPRTRGAQTEDDGEIPF
jgi:hypothetical protein